jgi:hypothetical protein
VAVVNKEVRIKLTIDGDDGKSIQKISTTAENSESKFKNLGLSIIAVNQAIELASRAFQVFAGPIQDAVGSFVEAERSMGRLASTLKLTGEFSQQVIDDFEAFAAQMQMNSTLGDEQVRDLITTGKALGLTSERTKQLAQASADLAAVTGKDVQASFVELTGQLSGTAGRLGKLIPELANMNAQQLRMGEGIDIVAKKFGGFAKAEAQTLAGAFKQIQEITGDVQEVIGELISIIVGLPDKTAAVRSTLLQIKDALTDFIDTAKRVRAAIEAIDWAKIAQGVTLFALALASINISAIAAGLATLATSVAALAAAAAPIVAISVAIIGVGLAVDILIRNLTRLDELAATLLATYDSLFARLQRGFNALAIGVLTAIETTLEGLARVGVNTEKELITVRATLLGLSHDIDDINTSIESFDGTLQDAAKNIDFGIAGEAAKFLNIILGDTKQIASDIASETEDHGRALAANIKLSKEQLDVIKSIEQENTALANDIANIGASQKQQILNALDTELKLLDLKRERLILDGKISDEAERALQAQGELLKARAEKRVADIAAPQLISSDTIQKLRDGIGDGAADLAGNINGALSSVASTISAAMGAVTSVLDFAQQVIDFIPTIINKVTSIFESLTALPQTILDSLIGVMGPDGLEGGLYAAVTGFIKDFIPSLLNNLVNIVESLLMFLYDGLPAAFENLLEKLPDIMSRLLDRLPHIVENFVVAFINAMPRITIAMVEFLIMHAPRIALKMMEVFAIRLPIAIVKGIIEGAKQFIERVSAFFSGKKFKAPKWIEELPETASKALKNISKEASQIFQVKDLEDAVKGIDLAERLKTIIDDAAKKMMSAFDYLKKIWMWIWDNILWPIIGFFREVWLWIYETILKPIIDAFRFLWTWIYDTILKPVLEAFRVLFTWISEKIVQPIMTALQRIVEFIGTFAKDMVKGIWDGLKAAFSGAKTFFSEAGVWIWEGLKKALGGLGSFLKGIFDKLNPANLFEKIFRVDYKGRDTVEKALNIDIPFVNFATGGLVPGKAQTPGDSLLNDRILALLSPGEAIIPRSLMGDPAVKAIVNAILSGKLQVPQFAFGGIGKAIGGAVSGAKDLGGTISDVGKDIGGGISSATKDAGGFVSQAGKDALKKLGIDLNAAWRMVQERTFAMVMQMFRENAFATGGLVTGSGFGDSVPAMLTPGEFVVRRRSAQNNLGMLGQLNRTGSAQGGAGVVIQKIEINAKTNLDADAIRREVIPAVEKHLKRASLDGKPLIAASGVYTR